MTRLLVCLLLSAALSGCASPYRLVYASDFSFANYDYVVVAKPAGDGHGALFGLDIDFANLMGQCNMKVIGDKELATLPPESQARTLFARLSLVTSDDDSLITVSFDDATTGKTVASITGEADGDMLDSDDRQEAFEAVSQAIVRAIQRDKGLTVTDEE